MKRLVCFFILALVPLSAWAANDVYIAQTQAGTGDGLSCANAKAYTYFNTSGNWSATPTGIQIGPDTTVHLCGVLTPSQSAAALTFQGSGTSGHPVNLFFETGARIDGTPYCGTSGCINLNGKSYLLIDGGTSCGKANGSTSSTVSCNGVIRNMLAGSSGQTCPGGTCSSVLSSSTITALILDGSGTSAGIEIRNLQLGPSYIRALNAVGEGQATRSVEFYHAFPTNIRIHHNIFVSAAKHAQIDGQDNITGTWNGYEYDHNDFSDQCWTIGAGTNTSSAGSGSSITGILVHDNEMSNWTNWVAGDPSNCHGNGTMFFNYYNNTSSSTHTIGDSTSLVYNNYIHGDLTGGVLSSSPSGLLSCQDNCVNVGFFNNLVLNQCTGTNPSRSCGGTFYFNGPGGGGQRIYNNTLACSGSSSAVVVTGTTGAADLQNNIFTGCGDLVEIRPNCPTCATGDRNDGYGLSTWVVNNSASSGQYISLATWRSTYGQDVNSVTTNPNLDANNKLPAGSPAISLGANLTSLSITALNSDLSGVARPSGSTAWDAGAYQYAAPALIQYAVAGAISIQGAITVKLAVCGSTNYPCGNSTSSTINISHPNLGPNSCDWTSLSTLATCGNTTGVNTIVTPGDFGSQRLLRLTDCNTLTNCGDVWLSADDGLPTLSNMDSTRWIIKRNGGQRYLASFDPATMQTAGLSAISLDPQESTFSRTTQNVLYQLTGGAGTSKVILKKHTITTNANPTLDSDSVTTIKDLGADANCFGASFTAAWTSLLLSPAGNDTVFSISASTGSQGSANLTVSYDTSTAQCTVLDTSTGAVTQNGASLGNYTSYSGSTTDLFHPHEAYQTPNSRYVVIVGTSSNYIQGTYNSGFYVWDLQNPLSLKSCLNCSGHFDLGANGVVFGKSLIFTPYSAPTSTGTSTFLPSPPSYPDIHPSWNNGNSGDTLWMLNKAQDDTATPVNPLSGFSVAFFDEIFMVKPDGSGAVSRQHHTFGSSNPNLPFDCQINAANISQDGKWVMWTTDGMGQFGSTSGAGTCTPGTDCRCELVIGELK